MMFLDDYFAAARERQQIYLNKEAGLPRPWTKDPVMDTWAICNVDRELDRTTRWFRENIRDLVRTHGIHTIEATLIFRWFNRIETCEIIKDLMLDKWDSAEAIRRLRGRKPIVTGAYIILGEKGYTKLIGVCRAIDRALEMLPAMWEKGLFHGTMEQGHEALQRIPYMGRFMAYEVVSDLRWTSIYEHAPDILTWANPGPGCTRGMSRVMTGRPDTFTMSASNRIVMLEHMRHILKESENPLFWPSEWKSWEMREVEHWSCEFDKIMRARKGHNLKRKYTPSGR